MPSLSERQSCFAHAVLHGASDIGIRKGAVSTAAALSVHRNTVIGALVNALRLAYPSVLALVGDAYFEAAAAIFSQAHPPSAARLSGYGAGFGDFLAVRTPSLPYLADVARLDRALEVAACAPDTTRRFALDENVMLQWPVSLALLALDHPAGEIRAALGDDAALAAIDVTPRPRHLLVWRSGRQVFTREIGAVAAIFAAALLAGDIAAAQAAAAQAPDAIHAEILTASFSTILIGDPA